MIYTKLIATVCKVCGAKTNRGFFKDVNGKEYSTIIRHSHKNGVCHGGSLTLDDLIQSTKKIRRPRR